MHVRVVVCVFERESSVRLSADWGGGSLPQVGCKALAFPKQFKTQQYYNILKHICPEVEKAHPGFLRSQRWDVPG